MVYFSKPELPTCAGGTTAACGSDTLGRSARAAYGTYDVSLSHSVSDARVVLGITNMPEDQNPSDYVDWIDDKDLDREQFAAATAAGLRLRMANSRSLIYATSRAASNSRWMPWELGFFDGKRGPERVSILPIESAPSTAFVGQDYLGQYKALEKVLDSGQRLPHVGEEKDHRAETLASFTQGRDQFVGRTYQ